MTLAEPHQFDDPETKERIRKTKRNDNLGASVVIVIGALVLPYIGVPLWTNALMVVTMLPVTLVRASLYMGHSYVE